MSRRHDEKIEVHHSRLLLLLFSSATAAFLFCNIFATFAWRRGKCAFTIRSKSRVASSYFLIMWGLSVIPLGSTSCEDEVNQHHLCSSFSKFAKSCTSCSPLSSWTSVTPLRRPQETYKRAREKGQPHRGEEASHKQACFPGLVRSLDVASWRSSTSERKAGVPDFSDLMRRRGSSLDLARRER